MSAHFRLIYEELTAKRLKFILYDSFSHTWDVGANPNGRLFAPKTGHVLRHHFAGYRSLKFGSFFIDKAVFRLDFLRSCAEFCVFRDTFSVLRALDWKHCNCEPCGGRRAAVF